jgi:glc operon protein GlcG
MNVPRFVRSEAVLVLARPCAVSRETARALPASEGETTSEGATQMLSDRSVSKLLRHAQLGAAASLLSAAIVHGAGAQLIDKKVLSLDAAKRVAAAAAAEAKARKATVVIAVVDDGGHLLVLERLDDTQVASVEVGIGKARTAAIFRRPSKEFEEQIRNGRAAALALPGATPLQGGVPILSDGKVIGAIGVSGNTPQEDEAIAIAGAAAMDGLGAADTAADNAVSYYDSKTVAAAFAKGAVLSNGAGGRNYMVHASRREGAGEAEVHAKDTDIIYVLDGSATFVTGGTVVDPKTTAPDEVRGREVRQGETRQLAKGDVIIVPNGTPHWFKEVAPPFTYYVVKVR